MELCPYCGEEVPDDSPRCWKCGTEIAEGTAPAASEDEDEPEERLEPEPERHARRDEVAACPFCDAPMPGGSAHCSRCGRTVLAPEAVRGAIAWKLGPWIVFLAVAGAASLLVALVIAKRLGHRPTEVAKVTVQDLTGRFDPTRPPSPDDEKRQAVWDEHFRGRRVQWEKHVVLSWSVGTNNECDVYLAAEPLPATEKHADRRADVVVSFLKDQSSKVKSLLPGNTIGYSARLVGFGDKRAAFRLDQGLLQTDR